MTIKFQCPQCKKAFSVKNENSGKKARCPCGAKLVVPSGTPVLDDLEEINIKSSQSHKPGETNLDQPSESCSHKSSHDVDEASSPIFAFGNCRKRLFLPTLIICLLIILFPPYMNDARTLFTLGGLITDRNTGFILVPPSNTITVGGFTGKLAEEWHINPNRLYIELGIVFTIGIFAFLVSGFLKRDTVASDLYGSDPPGIKPMEPKIPELTKILSTHEFVQGTCRKCECTEIYAKKNKYCCPK